MEERKREREEEREKEEKKEKDRQIERQRETMEVTVLDPSVALRQLVESRFGKLSSGKGWRE